MSWLLLTGLLIYAAAAVLDLSAGRHASSSPYWLASAGSACLAAVGITTLTGHPIAPTAQSVLAVPDGGFGTDQLTGLFLLIAYALAAPICLARAANPAPPDPDTPTPRGLAAVLALTLTALALVLTAQGVFGFLLGWETLTLAFYLLTAFERRKAGRAAAAVLTVGFGKASGALLLLGLLLLAAGAHTLTFTGLAAAHGTARETGYALLVAGFAVKVGLVPVQIWLPAAYPAAPGPARAIMAGIAVNAGFYGLWRTLAVLGAPPHWLPLVLLPLAAASALLGIAHATVHTRLTRVIAYSSIENTGLILAGYGIALVGADQHSSTLMAVGLLAATLQLIAHAIAKSLLFSSAAVIQQRYRTDDLDALRGVARRLPFAGSAFTAGALTLAGLPPTIGFVSEWFLLEALLQQFRLAGLPAKLTLAVTGAAVALTVGFAGVAFARLVGLTILGDPGTHRRPPGPDRVLARSGRLALALTTAGCLALAVLTPLEIRVIARGLTPLVPASTLLGALKGPWVLQPVYPGFSILAPTWLWIMLPALALGVTALLLAASRGRAVRVRRVPAWRSATEGVEGEDCYTSFGYANPTRRVLANILLTRTALQRLHSQQPRRETGYPGLRAPDATLGYTSDVVEVVDTYLYRPLRRPLRGAVTAAKRLQSGRLDAYIAYMLIALIGVIALVVAMA
ncbi:MAG TPA: proton-conducting transporter membrane subunit [Actinocrinis sp.]|jgi:formate hydrogenlyase subunit 3/multisubunit Na+/H+ antiporter MnhD subunit